LFNALEALVFPPYFAARSATKGISLLDQPARRRNRDRLQARLPASDGGARPDVRAKPRRLGLAGRVLLVTIGFALLAICLFYVARLAAFRETWFHNKLAAAETTVEAFDDGQPGAQSPDLARKVLTSVGAKAITISAPQGVRTLSNPAAPSPPLLLVDLDRESFVDSVRAAFRTLVAEPGTLVRVTGTSADGDRIEVTLDETPLIEATWRVSHTFLSIAVMIAAVVAGVLWTALWLMVLRPMRRLTSNIVAFGESPQDVSRVIGPSGRHDEIGRAETALAAMQRSLAHELHQRKRLSELGMAVARINHDLRNILSAAQLMSDRLATIEDPQAQRLAPRLVATLDRAIKFCQATLTYGAGADPAPERRRFDLDAVVREALAGASAGEPDAVDYQVDIPPRFEVYADPDHILRVFENLTRNAAAALTAMGAESGRPKAIRLAAIRVDGVAIIEVSDTGPGFPADQGDRIFEPFQKSTSQSGAGLGLSIAADLVIRNGGSIELAPRHADDFYCGARFLIKLPTPERAAINAPRLALLRS
jgi:signal transduction histidine kinase